MAAMKIPAVSGLCGIYSPNSGLQPIPLANTPSPNHPPPKLPGSLSKLTAFQARPAARLLHTIPLPDAENLPSLNHSCLVSQPSLPHPAPQSPSNHAATTHPRLHQSIHAMAHTTTSSPTAAAATAALRTKGNGVGLAGVRAGFGDETAYELGFWVRERRLVGVIGFGSRV